MKTIVITGCTSGIGKATALDLLEKGYAVIGLVRNEDKAYEVFRDHKHFTSIECDLEEFESIKRAANELLESDTKIDVLINNAGAMFQGRQISVSGHEKTLMVNHIAPFYLTKLLIPSLLKSSARIINLSSALHTRHKVQWDDLELKSNYSSVTAYANAKLYTIWFTKLLHSKYHKDGLSSFAVHPGLIGSNFGDNLGVFGKLTWNIMKLFIKSPEQGAESSIYLATAEDTHSLSGRYIIDKKEAIPDNYAEDLESAQRLWNISKEWYANAQ